MNVAAPAATAGGDSPAPAAPAAPANSAPAAPAANAAPAAANPPANEPNKPETPPAANNDWKVRDDYKDKPWAAKIKSEEDLYKQLDNLDQLVGKKNIAPDFKTATPKQIEDYYAQTRPADKAEYKFGEDTPEDLKGAYSDILYKNGINTHQAESLVKEVNEIQGKAFNEALSSKPVSELLSQPQFAPIFNKEAFGKELETSFGKNFAPIATATAKEIKSNLSTEDAALLEKVPNQYLGLIYRLTNNMVKAYGVNEGDAASNAPNSPAQAPDVTAQRKQIRADIAALQGKAHTADEKAALVAKLDATYQTNPTKR